MDWLWSDIAPAIAPAAWYILAKEGYNPLAVGNKSLTARSAIPKTADGAAVAATLRGKQGNLFGGEHRDGVNGDASGSPVFEHMRHFRQLRIRLANGKEGDEAGALERLRAKLRALYNDLPPLKKTDSK